MKKLMYHGAEPTVIPGFGAIAPGLVELPDELAALLLAAGEKTGDYSDPEPALVADNFVFADEPEPAPEEAEPHKKARRAPREE